MECRSVILQLGLGGPFFGPDDPNHVKSEGLMVGKAVHSKKFLAGTNEALSLSVVDGLQRLAALSGLHFHEDQNVAIATDKVDLPTRSQIITRKHPDSLALQKTGGVLFATIAEPAFGGPAIRPSPPTTNLLEHVREHENSLMTGIAPRFRGADQPAW